MRGLAHPAVLLVGAGTAGATMGVLPNEATGGGDPNLTQVRTSIRHPNP